jgi:DNA-binding XRE family transcriptional regulator
MYSLQELSQAVRTRRADIGLTQATVAKLSGLSRATVNAVEKGSIQDLSLKRATKLLAVLGLQVRVESARGNKSLAKTSSALEIAARTASVSYRNVLSSEDLKDALLTGNVPDLFAPHIYTLLEEGSVAMLAALVEQMHHEFSEDRAAMWQSLRDTARQLQCDRVLWQ